MAQTKLKVFISYSWDSEEHKDWVFNLAKKLIEKYSIDVILDRYDLLAGDSMTYFMENSLDISDKVLMILTPSYKLKANERKGGVGYEHSMISQGLFKNQKDNTKFIPVLRRGRSEESAPMFIESLIYHSMVDDNRFESDLEELARLIYDKPKLVKPELGDFSGFNSTHEPKDPILERANKVVEKNEIENKRLQFYKSEDLLSGAYRKFCDLIDLFYEKAKYYNENTDIRFWIPASTKPHSIFSGGIPSCSLVGNSYCFYFSLIREEKQIQVLLFDKPVPTSGFVFPHEKAKQLENPYFFNIEVNDSLEIIWLTHDNIIMDNKDISSKYFSRLIDLIEIS